MDAYGQWGIGGEVPGLPRIPRTGFGIPSQEFKDVGPGWGLGSCPRVISSGIPVEGRVGRG